MELSDLECSSSDLAVVTFLSSLQMDERFKFCNSQVVDLVKGKNELSSFWCESYLSSYLYS